MRTPTRPRESVGIHPTLRGRLSLLALCVIAAWLIVLAAAFDLVLLSRLSSQIDDSLRVRAQAASANARISAGVVTGVRESASDSELDTQIWIYGAARAVERPTSPPDLQRIADSLIGTQGLVERAGQRFFVLPITVRGATVGTVVSATALAPFDRTRDIAVLGSAAVTVLLLAGAYPVLRLTMRRALRPVATMTQQANDWSVHSPDRRFAGTQNYAELDGLAGSLDELLDRLAAVLRHERHLSAELSHELRTPLSRIAAEAELMLARSTGAQRDGLRNIADNCSAMDRIMDSLLAAARGELTRTVGRCELGPVFAHLGPAPPGKTLRVAAHRLTVGVDAAVVSRILAPIVDNAYRYASDTVEVQALRTEHAVVVEVANDGPTMPAHVAEQVFEPGFRENPEDGHDGAGLGLALARRLARAADGDLLIDTARPRTVFVVRLPSG